MGNWWRCGLCLGAGIAIGAAAAILLSRNSATIRKGMASVLSHTMDLKDKAKGVVSTAKENLDDIAAEARQESASRRSAKA
ncbi:MAG: hypothetical protein LBM64_10025 [Deltaproteobacteria bacterium]|jgi:gas vesicle protein|nr:hypothetical protein [Deltaproteobacteria bacterium]